MLLSDIFEAMMVPDVGRKRPARPRIYMYCHQTLNGWPGDGERFWVMTRPARKWQDMLDNQVGWHTAPTGHVILPSTETHDQTIGEYEAHSILANSRAEADDVMRQTIARDYSIKDLERYRGWFLPETSMPPEYKAWTKTPQPVWDGDDY